MARTEVPSDLTPDQRLRELAAILATGVLRVQRLRSLVLPAFENAAERRPEIDRRTP